jgi:hypothetical protein
MPTLNWTNPAAILFGTPLSATQLNATANSPGTLIYAPPLGTVLPGGFGRVLSVKLIPEEPFVYEFAYASASIDVSNIVTVTTAEDSGPGSLRSALAQAAGGTVIVNFSSDLDGETIYPESEYVILNPTVLNGRGADKLTISGDNATRLFNIQTYGSVSISGITIARGTADIGGGIRCANAQFSLADCIIRDCSAQRGGGLAQVGNGQMMVRNCSFVGNSAIDTGDNSAGGGAVFNHFSLSVIEQCTFSSNRVVDGVGGGAIMNEGYMDLLDSTVAGNSSSAGGGGIQHAGNFSTLVVQGSIVANNLSSNGTPDVGGAVFSGGFNLIGRTAGTNGFTNGIRGDIVGSVVTRVDPLLGPLQDNGGTTLTHALLPGSPAINAGTNVMLRYYGDPYEPGVPVVDLLSTADQRGTARVQGGIVDIGAYEWTGTNMVTRVEFSTSLLQLDFTGYPRLPYRLLVSTNLTDWAKLGTLQQSDSGLLHFTDSNPPPSRRFYRVGGEP